jgi:hypothetical protein
MSDDPPLPGKLDPDEVLESDQETRRKQRRCEGSGRSGVHERHRQASYHIWEMHACGIARTQARQPPSQEFSTRSRVLGWPTPTHLAATN